MIFEIIIRNSNEEIDVCIRVRSLVLKIQKNLNDNKIIVRIRENKSVIKPFPKKLVLPKQKQTNK